MVKDVVVIVLDNEYKDVKINGNTRRIEGMYAYAFGTNRNDVADKYTWKMESMILYQL